MQAAAGCEPVNFGRPGGSSRESVAVNLPAEGEQMPDHGLNGIAHLQQLRAGSSTHLRGKPASTSNRLMIQKRTINFGSAHP